MQNLTQEEVELALKTIHQLEGTTTGAGKGPKRTAKTTPDRVVGTEPDARPSDVRKGKQDAPLKKKTKKKADFQPISSVVPQAAPNILFIPEKTYLLMLP